MKLLSSDLMHTLSPELVNRFSIMKQWCFIATVVLPSSEYWFCVNYF